MVHLKSYWSAQKGVDIVSQKGISVGPTNVKIQTLKSVGQGFRATYPGRHFVFTGYKQSEQSQFDEYLDCQTPYRVPRKTGAFGKNMTLTFQPGDPIVFLSKTRPSSQ